jgi:hypothetical protein
MIFFGYLTNALCFLAVFFAISLFGLAELRGQKKLPAPVVLLAGTSKIC